jgi:hypothetical protein
VELHALLEEQTDIPKNEIHYKNERYDRDRKQIRSDVVFEYVTFQNHREAPLHQQKTETRFYITNNCFVYKHFVWLTPEQRFHDRLLVQRAGTWRRESGRLSEIVAKSDISAGFCLR